MMQEDLRVIRTRQSLGQAFNKLMKEKSFTSISVNELVHQAMIGRSTFYDHFEDKFSLLEWYLQDQFDVLSKDFEHQSLEERISALLSYILENDQFFKNLIESRYDHDVQSAIRRAWINGLRDHSPLEMTNLLDETISKEILIDFISAGLANSMIQWIKREYKMNAEEFLRYQTDIIMKCIQ